MLDPATARPRPDLAFLTTRSARTRSAPAPVQTQAPAAAVRAPAPPSPAPSTGLSLDLDLDAAPSTPPPPPASLDLGDLGSLDLSAPAATPAPPATAPLAPPAPPSLPTPEAPRVSSTPSFSGSLLDLDGDTAESDPTPPRPAASPAASPAPGSAYAATTPSAPSQPVRELGPRIPENGRAVLIPSAPTVALPRTTSGIGTLTVEAAIAAEVGEISLGCAFFLADGTTTFFNPDAGQRSAPADARMPLFVGARRRFAQIELDLRQIRHVERALFIVHSVPRTPVAWGGTLVITTHPGDRVEVPLEPGGTDIAVAAVSLYQVRGEIVLRAELEAAASVRDACVAFGYDAITWLDDRSPVA